MDNNLGIQTPLQTNVIPNISPQTNPIPQVDQGLQQIYQPSTPNNRSRKWLFLGIIIVLILLLAVPGAYFFYLNLKTNMSVPKQITTRSVATFPSPIPTPTVYQINPSDTSNQALNNDNQAVDQSLNSANQDLNSVDQSFNDQQPSLQ
jgi:hypothetical protein